MILWYTVIFVSILPSVFADDGLFNEALILTPLPDGKVYAHFEFAILQHDMVPRSPRSLDDDNDDSHHYSLFPLQLGQILRTHAVTELHLNLNAGKWDYQRWGYPYDYGVGAGAEIWVWLADGSKTSVDKRWEGLVNGLSGLFCASLGGLDEKRTTTPTYAFRPEGDLLADESYQLRHAFLPSESVCTENLTPFLKLLPCKSRSGIAQLLNPHRLFDASWHGIGVHVSWSELNGINLKLDFGAVLDPVRLSGGKRDWSFRTLFDSEITRSCPVADKSEVHVQVPYGEPYHITPEPSGQVLGSRMISYDTQALHGNLDIAMFWPLTSHFYNADIPPQTNIVVKRRLTGASQTNGGIHYEFTNHEQAAKQVTCVETAPWFINYFLHTRRTTIEGVVKDSVIRHIAYTPTISHRPTLLETVLLLPPNSTTEVTMSFSKSFIAYTEHPPDAERGWDLPPAVITFGNGESNSDQRIYTLNLLIDLPTPDFSMPYNVIIMTSTVIALFFGSIFNLLTRKFVWVRVTDQSKIVLKHG